MRLTTVILIASLLQVSAATFGQRITINERNKPLEAILKEIRKQSGYDFFYDGKTITQDLRVSVTLNNATIETALEVVLRNVPLTYEIKENRITIKKKEEPSFLENILSRFQTIDIKGKVVDSLGNGLPGATVSVKNGKGSTSTAANGDFTLKDVEESSLLTISHLGYLSKEVAVNRDFNYIQLQISTLILDEVQVLAYGLTSRRLSTGNVATLKSTDIEKQVVTNPLLLLQGRIPGLIVTPTNGLPGSSVNVQLRGQNSLAQLNGRRGITEPLYIIDGVPMSNNISSSHNSQNTISALSLVNPLDIESIDIQKDADATAIYGSRGANGVIIITTKRGGLGATKVNLNASTGFGEVANPLRLLNTEQYLEMRKEAYINDGTQIPNSASPSIEKNNSNYDLTLWDQTRYTDWQRKLIGGVAKYNNIQASIGGGVHTIYYLISGTYTKQGYVFPGQSRSASGSGRFSLNGSSVDGKFKALFSGGYTSNANTSPYDFTNLSRVLAPNAPEIYNSDGLLNWEPDPETGLSTWINPYAKLLEVSKSNTRLVNSTADFTYRILPFLILKTTLGFNEVNGRGTTVTPIASKDPSILNLTGESRFLNNSSNSFSVEPQIIFNTRISKGGLNVLLGSSYQGQNLENGLITARGFKSDAVLENLASANAIGALPAYTARNSSSQYKYSALFGRFGYNWQDKYLLNINVRRDGSSRFGPERSFGNFASVGAAWIFTNENVFKNAIRFVDFGKLRFSYGTSGNDGIGNYQYIELYSPEASNVATYQGIKTISSGGAINPYYGWESVHKLEYGFETSLFSNRLMFTVVMWRNRSSNQLGILNLPTTVGAMGSFIANADGKIQNRGNEFTVNADVLKGKNFIWSTAINLSFQNNKVLNLPKDVTAISAYGGDVKEGEAFSGIVTSLRKFYGLNPLTGLYQFIDTEGNISSDPNADIPLLEKVNISSQYFGGISSTMTYKGLSLDIGLQFVNQNGRKFLNQEEFGYPGVFYSNRYGNQPIHVLNRWREVGDVTEIQKYSARLFAGDAYGLWSASQRSDFAYSDASYLRLNNLAISYRLSTEISRRLLIKSINIYLKGQNLWTISAYKGGDPEIQSLVTLPQLRVITAGIQLTL